MKDGLYHVETGIPWELFTPFELKNFGLDYGQHARRAALDDRYGQLTSVPLTHKFTRAEVFEVEVEQGRIVKFAARLTGDFSTLYNGCRSFEYNKSDAVCLNCGKHYSKHLDLILVLTPSLREPGNLFVKTLWLNERTDGHGTLDKSKYIPHP